MRFEGDLKMRHILQVLVEDVGLEEVTKKVINPVDFSVAGYYGTPMLQEGAVSEDDPHNPKYFSS